MKGRELSGPLLLCHRSLCVFPQFHWSFFCASSQLTLKPVSPFCSAVPETALLNPTCFYLLNSLYRRTGKITRCYSTAAVFHSIQWAETVEEHVGPTPPRVPPLATGSFPSRPPHKTVLILLSPEDLWVMPYLCGGCRSPSSLDHERRKHPPEWNMAFL